MKKILILFVPILLLVSCNKNNQYVYIEVLDDYDLFNNPKITVKEPCLFEAANDSIAFCIAVDKFFRSALASKRTQELLNKKGVKVKYPSDFRLYTKDSTEISEGTHLMKPEKIIENADKKYKELSAEYLN